MMHRVFVYGTLRPGEHNHGYLTAASHLGGFVTAPAYILCDTGVYPAARDGGSTALIGDVFAVTNATFAELDVLEGYPRHYTRRRIATAYGPAWIYIWSGSTDPAWPRIEHGDWCAYRRETTDNGLTDSGSAL